MRISKELAKGSRCHTVKITTTYWKTNPDWYDYDENDEPYLTEKAPPEAHESFRLNMEKIKKTEKTGIIYN